MYDTEHRQAAVKLSTAIRSQQEAIRNDKNLSPLAKQRLLARDFLAGAPRLTELRTAHETATQEERLRLQQAAYGHPADRDAFRTALERATAEIKTQESAETALRRAERTGDDVLAAAVFDVAVEHGYGKVVQAYTARRPGAAKALQDLEHFEVSLDRSAMSERLFSPFFSQRPPELPGNSDALAKLAREAPEIAGHSASVAPVDDGDYLRKPGQPIWPD